jgi:predicted O-methyltransferase YrrM
MNTIKFEIDREIEEDEGGIYISKTVFKPFTGGALKLASSFGYMTAWEVLTLQVLCRSLPANAILVNVGSGAGTSALAMAEARGDLIKTIYSCDNREDGGPFGGLLPERNAFCQYNTPLINQIVGDSYDTGNAWNKGKISLAFIDGNHSLEGVQRDIDAWLPHIQENGYMLFHDYHHGMHRDVKPTVDRMMAAHEQIMVIDLLAVYRIHKPCCQADPETVGRPVFAPKKPRAKKVTK